MKRCSEKRSEEKRLNEIKINRIYSEQKHTKSSSRRSECSRKEESKMSSRRKWWRNLLRTTELNRWISKNDEWKNLSTRRKLSDSGKRSSICTKSNEHLSSLRERLLNGRRDESRTSLNKRKQSFSLSMARSSKNIIPRHQLNMELASSNLKILTCLLHCLRHRAF